MKIETNETSCEDADDDEEESDGRNVYALVEYNIKIKEWKRRRR